MRSTFEPQIVEAPARRFRPSRRIIVLAMYARGMKPARHRATIKRHLRQMSHEQISPSQVRHGRGSGMAESSAPVVLSICFRRLHLRIAHWVWRQQVAVYVMLAYDVSSTQRISLASWIDGRKSKHAWMQILTGCGLGGVKDLWHPVHGWRELELEERRQGCIPHATVQRRIVPHPQFIHYITQASECITKAAEAHLWCHQHQSRPSRNSGIQDRLAEVRRPGQRMGKQFLTSAALCFLAVPCADVPYTTNAIERQSLLPQGDQERRFPQRGCSLQDFLRIKSSIKNGRVVTSQTGAMVGTSCSWTTGCLSLCEQYDVVLNRLHKSS